MRTALAFLVLYANAVAPWLCCCATAKALTAVSVHSPDAPQKKSTCAHCGESQNDPVPDRTPVPKPCQCPIQERLTVGTPDLFVERAETQLASDRTGLEPVALIAITPPSIPTVSPGELSDGPALRTADRMRKYHHRFLC